MSTNPLFFYGYRFCLVMSILLAISCENEPTADEAGFSQITEDPEVAEYLSQFAGRGDMADESGALTPEEALARFVHPEDLRIDLIASEPLIHQPVEINFDQRGRLWVVQYNQYPFPAGLKVTDVDWHLRMQFDTVPLPPPDGVEGADKITMLEDTDGDGRADRAVDVITGLNIVTGITWGRGQIWVLNPPYLLAYPDSNDDGIPDGKPRVHLRGFGLEDTHAVANSLCWGPDGWLYGAQGSTTTAKIISSVSQVNFQGQGIWRYHPETEIFELFAEGGGNTFHVEIDDKGRIYSGHNGVERGPYYKQGAYYPKNWGKHGPLTNPYAFGFLPHMTFEGEALRFTHAFVRYGGNDLPDIYQDALIAINPLHNFLQLSHFEPEGSTFKTIDQSRLLTTDDGWFRPVDIQAGPDGAIYLADWYDGRLSHISPIDDWHKSSGRIYALRNAQSEPAMSIDFGTLSVGQLIEHLAHANRWHRQQALRQLGDRGDKQAIETLRPLLLQQEDGQLALESLWGIHLCGGFDQDVSAVALQHADPFVRMWAVRLMGDQHILTPQQLEKLVVMAALEKHPEVRSQLACSAKRLPALMALPILQSMLHSEQDQDDPQNPLLIWWALEDKAESDRQAVLDIFSDRRLWQREVVQETILHRLIQRYVMAGGQQNLQSAARLFSMAPTAQLGRPLLLGLDEGLRGRALTGLSDDLLREVDILRKKLGVHSLDLALQKRQPEAIARALEVAADVNSDRLERTKVIRIFGDMDFPEAAPVLLDIVQSNTSSPAMRQAALRSLRRYDLPEIGAKVSEWYPDRLRSDPDVRQAALELLVSRVDWVAHLLTSIDVAKRISPEDLTLQLARRIPLLDDSDLNIRAQKIWPDLALVATEAKEDAIREYRKMIQAEPGEIAEGKLLFTAVCGSCHTLFGEGNDLGPDLTGYDRSDLNYLLQHTVDPNVEIREGYINFWIETKDGRNLAGTIADQSGGTITLRNFDGSELTLAESEITRMEAQKQSLMPERLLEVLSKKQLQDLFAYLMAGPS